MWAYLFMAVCVLFVIVDARSRKAPWVGWAIGTLLLAPVVLGLYLAKRPLRAGETREGGTGWNLMKYFAFAWTAMMALAGIAAMMSVGEHSRTLTSDAERAGAAIGTALGLGMIVGLWFVVTVGALVLGLFLKKSSIVERGPTGPLAATEASNAQAAGV